MQQGEEEILIFKEVLSARSFAVKFNKGTARFVGQEDDGSILVAWDACAATEDAPVTCLGLYLPAGAGEGPDDTCTTLYEHGERAEVCGATVNRERTLLAYTVRSDEGGAGESYDTYVAEVQPRGRVFCLNVGGDVAASRSCFRRAQFVQPGEGGGGGGEPVAGIVDAGGRYYTSALLLALLGDSITLYQFRLQAVEDGAVLATRPEGVPLLAGKFDWYQWVPKKQWLYYASFSPTWTDGDLNHSKGPDRGDRLREGEGEGERESGGSLVFSCLSFAREATGQAMITLSLPLPYPTCHYTADAPTYFPSPFAHVAPLQGVNLQVLHRPDGLWCVGLQHTYGTGHLKDGGQRGEGGPSSSPALLRSNGDGGGGGGLVDYSLYILHGGQVLRGRVALPMATPLGARLHFMLVRGMVVVYASGLLLHLLNVGPDADHTYHHLLFDHNHSPTLSSGGVAWVERSGVGEEGTPRLSPAVDPRGGYTGDRAVFVECGTQSLYTCDLNPGALLGLFKATPHRDLKVGVLHVAVVALRHGALGASMVEHLCRHPSPANVGVFAEYVVCSAYSNVVVDCHRYITRQLPSSSSSYLPSTPTVSSHGGDSVGDSGGWVCVVGRDVGGRVHSLLSLDTIPLFHKQLLVQSDRKWWTLSTPSASSSLPSSPDSFLQADVGGDILDQVCFNVALAQAGVKPINIREALLRLTPEVLGLLGAKVRQRRVVLDTAGGGVGEGGHLPFLTLDKDLRLAGEEQMRRVKQALYQSLSEPLLLQTSREVVRRVVKTYCWQLEMRSRELLGIAWASLGMGPDNHPCLDSIHRSGTSKERHLFEVLESYRLAHLDLGLSPPCGFHTLFACLGYLCLGGNKFAQCMGGGRSGGGGGGGGVFMPTGRFVQRLAQRGSLGQETAAYEVICALEEPLRKYALRLWANRLVEQSDEV